VTSRSSQLFAQALNHIPGGVNSPVRAFRGLGREPFFVDRAEGARIWDVDGNTYIDYVGSWGPAILGHAPQVVVDAIRETALRGVSFGIPNPLEVEMAELICRWVPSIEKVRMVNSGTEATMSCVRLARGFTGRKLIVKFEGCYHGHVDSLLVKAGSGALTFGHPDSAGIPAAFTQHTIALPFNDAEAVKAAFAANPRQIAAVIEPCTDYLYVEQGAFTGLLCRENLADGRETGEGRKDAQALEGETVCDHPRGDAVRLRSRRGSFRRRADPSHAAGRHRQDLRSRSGADRVAAAAPLEQRASALETEVLQLRAQLTQLRQSPNSP
jgi:hypothetical protein